MGHCGSGGGWGEVSSGGVWPPAGLVTAARRVIERPGSAQWAEAGAGGGCNPHNGIAIGWWFQENLLGQIPLWPIFSDSKMLKWMPGTLRTHQLYTIYSGNCQLGGNIADKVIKLGGLRRKSLDKVVARTGTNYCLKLTFLSTHRKTASLIWIAIPQPSKIRLVFRNWVYV